MSAETIIERVHVGVQAANDEEADFCGPPSDNAITRPALTLIREGWNDVGDGGAVI